MQLSMGEPLGSPTWSSFSPLWCLAHSSLGPKLLTLWGLDLAWSPRRKLLPPSPPGRCDTPPLPREAVVPPGTALGLGDKKGLSLNPGTPATAHPPRALCLAATADHEACGGCGRKSASGWTPGTLEGWAAEKPLQSISCWTHVELKWKCPNKGG